MRCDDPRVPAPLAVRLPHETNVAEPQIAQPAVHELRRSARGGAGGVAAIDERDLRTRPRRRPCRRGARRTAADHQHVEPGIRQPLQPFAPRQPARQARGSMRDGRPVVARAAPDRSAGAPWRSAPRSNTKRCVTLVDLDSIGRPRATVQTRQAMNPDLILALDQGTTGTRAALVDEAGERVAEAYGRTSSTIPRPASSSTTPRRSCSPSPRCSTAVLDSVEPGRVAGVGITNQRETIVLWERSSGRPVAPAIVWQDGRTAERCAELVAAGAEELVRSRTGLPLQPYFSATKLAWLLDNVPGARARANAASSLRARSTPGSPGTSPARTSATSRTRRVPSSSTSTASSGTTSCWSCSASPAPLLPRCRSVLARGRPRNDHRGRAGGTGAAAARPARRPAGGARRTGVPEQGDAKCTYGTGAFLLVNAGGPSPRAASLLTSLAYQPGRRAGRLLPRGRDGRGRPCDPVACRRARPDRRSVGVRRACRRAFRRAAAFASCLRSRGCTRRGGRPRRAARSRGSRSIRQRRTSCARRSRRSRSRRASSSMPPSARRRHDLRAPDRRRCDGKCLPHADGRRRARPAGRTNGSMPRRRCAARRSPPGWRPEPGRAPTRSTTLRGTTVTIEPRWDDDRRETEYADWLDAVKRVLPQDATPAS